MRRERQLRLTGPKVRLALTALFMGIAIAVVLDRVTGWGPQAFVPVAAVVAGGWLVMVLRQRAAATEEERKESVFWGTHTE